MNQTQAQAHTQAVTIDQVLTFKLNDSLFCIPVDLVESVIEMPEITDLPQSPAYIAGSFLYRRQTLLAIHMRALLGLPDTNQPRRPTMVVTNLEDQKVGLWIDEIKGLVDTGRCTISELPALAANQGVRQALLFNDQVIYPINVSAMSRLRTELDRIEAQRLEEATRAKAAAEAEALAQAESEAEAERAESSAALLAEPESEPEVALAAFEAAETEQPATDEAMASDVEATALAEVAPAEALLDADAREAEAISEAESIDQQDNVVALAEVISEPVSEAEHALLSPEIDETADSEEVLALDNSEPPQTEEEQAWWEQVYDAGSSAHEDEPEEETIADEINGELAGTGQLEERDLLEASPEVEPESEELELAEEALDVDAEAEVDKLLEDLVAEADPQLTEPDEHVSPVELTAEIATDIEAALPAESANEAENEQSPDLGELAAMMAALTKNKTADTETPDTVDADSVLDETDSVESLVDDQDQVAEQAANEVTTVLTDIEAANLDAAQTQDEVQTEVSDEEAELTISAYLAVPNADDDATLLELVEETLDASAEEEVDRLLEDLLTEEQEAGEEILVTDSTATNDELDEDPWTSVDDSTDSDITAETLEASLVGTPVQDESDSLDLDKPNGSLALSQGDSSETPQSPGFVTGHFPDPYASQTAFGELSYPVDDYADELTNSQHGLYEPTSVAEHASAANDYAESEDEADLAETGGTGVSESALLGQAEENTDTLGSESDSDEVRANLPALIESKDNSASSYDNSQPPPLLDKESRALAEVIQFRAKAKQESLTEEVDNKKPEPYVDVRTIITHAPGGRERHIVRNIMLGMLAIIIGGVVVWRQVDWSIKQKIVKQLPTEMQSTVAGVISYKMTIQRPEEGPDRLVVDLKDYEIRVIHADKVDPTLLKQRQGQNAKIYKVKKGDTLWKIAERYLKDPFSYPELAKNSDINKPNLIYPGDIVTVHRKIPD